MPITTQPESPYFDDFIDSSIESKNYQQILFKPGYSVQNRELNQLQSMLRSQIDKFGSAFYTNGTSVVDGLVTVKADLLTVDIETTNVPETVKTLKNASGVKADVLGYELLLDSNPDTYRFFIRYRTSDTATNLISTFSTGEVLVYVTSENPNDTTEPAGTAVAVGFAIGAFANKGIFFANGSFVLVEAQKTFRTLTTSESLFNGFVAFKITESVVTASFDETLYDNATGAPNFSAPGADRQTIALELLLVDNTETIAYDFCKLLLLVDSEVVTPARPDKNSSAANSLDDLLATRTYEESGNYSVRPFKLAMKEHYNTGTNFGKYTTSQLENVFPDTILEADRITLSKSKYIAGIEPSVAYVKGYRIQLTDRRDIAGNKARSFSVGSNIAFTAAQGNYLLTTGVSLASNFIFPSINDASVTYSLWTNDGGGGSEVGTCKIRNIERLSAGVFQIFIYELILNGPQSLLNAKSLALNGTSGTTARFINTDGFVLYDSGNDKNIFKFPYDAVKKVTSLQYSVRRQFSPVTVSTIPDPSVPGGVGANGQWLTILNPTTGPAGTFVSSSPLDYIVFNTTSGVVTAALTVEQIYIDGSGVYLKLPAGTTGTCQVIAPYVVNSVFNSKSPLQPTTTGALPARVYAAKTGINITFTDAALDRVNLPAHGLVAGDRVTFTSITGPTNIYVNTPYYVAGTINTNDFQIALTRGGAHLDINANGVGVMSSNSIIYLSNLDVVASSVSVAVGLSASNFTITSGTTTYSSAPTVTISAPTSGTTATATATLVGNVVTGITITDPGSGYTSAPTLTFSDGVVLAQGIDPTAVGRTTVSGDFSISDGITRNRYKTPTLVYTNSTPTSSVALTIGYSYYPHGATPGPYVVNSYSNNNIALEDIPSFEGGRLGDYIDFRNNENAVTSVRLDSNSTIVATVEYYLPRIDNVLVNSSGQFYIEEGTSSLRPTAQSVPEDAMILYSLYVPAYTYSISDIVPSLVNNKRYTMRDIGNIENRLSNIEYYTSLSLLERSAQDQQILTDSGVERYKNGILVDSFLGHNIGDVTNAAYKCAIDPENGILRAYYTSNNLDLKVNASIVNNNSALHSDNNITCVAYDDVVLIEQLFATANAESVNPFDMQTWNGTVELSPSSDEWKSTVVRPDVIINDTSAYDAIKFTAEERGVIVFHWNEWEVNWTGVTRKRSKRKVVTTTKSTSVRDGTRTTLSYADNVQSMGNNVVDISYVPFIRSRKIYFKATHLKPNTLVYPFFDDIDISDYTVSDAFVAFKDQTDSTIYDGNDNPLGLTSPTPIIPDATGKASGYFIIPNNSSLKFKTGERSFRLTDSATNSDSDFTTVAETKYHAAGLLETTQNTIISTRVPIFDKTRVTEARTNADVVRVRWRDPLAQSFILDRNQIDGAYVTKLDLYFKSKSTANIPVSVHIVTMENGMPTQNILPFSEVTKDATDVSISADATAATTFDFASPVYLQPGVEYAFVVESNDSDYKAFVSEVGKENITDTNAQIIAKNPYAGVMFKSQNGSTWSADQTKDMTFKLYRAQFETAIATREIELAGLSDDIVSFSSIRTSIANIVQNNTQMLWTLSIYDEIDGPHNIDISVNETIQFDRRFTAKHSNIKLTAALSTTSEYLSPYIDTDRTSILLIDNVINNTLTNELAFDQGSAAARYLTRPVDLNNPANQLNIYIAANRPTSQENISVYVNIKTDDSQILGENIPWILVPSTNIIPVSSDPEQYNEISYTYSSTSPFSRFAVKIVLTSAAENGPNTPSVKDFRAIATYGI